MEFQSFKHLTPLEKQEIVFVLFESHIFDRHNLTGSQRDKKKKKKTKPIKDTKLYCTNVYQYIKTKAVKRSTRYYTKVYLFGVKPII